MFDGGHLTKEVVILVKFFRELKLTSKAELSDWLLSWILFFPFRPYNLPRDSYQWVHHQKKGTLSLHETVINIQIISVEWPFWIFITAKHQSRIKTTTKVHYQKMHWILVNMKMQKPLIVMKMGIRQACKLLNI